MHIDHIKTFENFEAACLSQSKLARAIGVDKTVLNSVLHGKYWCMGSPSARKVIDELRRRDLLVEKQAA